MKIKEGFMLRTIGGEHVVVAVGNASYLLNGIIKLNNTGVLLWRLLEEGAQKQDLTGLLRQNYGISELQAEQDVEAFLNPLNHVGCIE